MGMAVIARHSWLQIFAASSALFLAGCQAAIPVESDAFPATPLSESIQLGYQPFRTIRYHLTVGGSNESGSISVSSNVSVTGERVAGRMRLTIRFVGQQIVNGVSRTAPNGGQDYQTRVTIDDDGRIIDVATNSRKGTESADDAGVLERMNTFVTWVLPIYTKGPVSVGQPAARTAIITAADGRSHFTMILAGSVNYQQKPALKLDIDKSVFDETYKPNLPDSFPERGYFIVDPGNGTVLKARWFNRHGEELASVDKL